MEKKAKVICSVVGFLGLLSYALGIAAEITRKKTRFLSIKHYMRMGFDSLHHVMIDLVRGTVRPPCLSKTSKSSYNHGNPSEASDVIYHSTPSVSIWCWTPWTPQEQDHVLWHPLLLLCGALSLFKCCCLLPSFCAYPDLVSIQMGHPQRPPLQYPPPQCPPPNIEAPVVLNTQT